MVWEQQGPKNKVEIDHLAKDITREKLNMQKYG